jgi:flagellar biosynthesis/type III secretory pathway chaperone
MTAIDQLSDILHTQADLADALLAVVKQQQAALVHAHLDDLNKTVERESELLKPMQQLEGERVRLTRKITEELSSGEFSAEQQTKSIIPQEILQIAPERLQVVGGRLSGTVTEIMEINRQNRNLLDHSLSFVRESIRILTQDYSRQLIDQKL